MNSSSSKIESAKKDITFRLQTKFLIGILFLEALLMSAIILVVENQMRESILDEFLKRGLSVTRNLAAVNNDFVTTYNYVKVEQNLEWVVKENGLLYATVVFFDGEVAVYEGLEQMKRVLTGSLHEHAQEIDDTLIQYGKIEGEEFCEIAVPIFLKGENWGTVRAGFSLDDMHAAVVRTRKVLLGLGCLGLFCGWLASIFLARRITRPINHLVESVKAIANGEYNQLITINTRDEIGYLGKRFAAMQETLKEQFQLLADTNEQLSASNNYLQREIAERQKKEEQIHYLAFYDNVTGLPNRALLKEHLSHTLLQAKRYKQSAAVLFLDLDHFKRINDTLGHSIGDKLLREVADRLADCVRECDFIIRPEVGKPGEFAKFNGGNTVARLGGDEFVIVLTRIRCPEDAAIIARRVNHVLASPFTLNETQVYITASIGISGYPGDGDDAETLLKHADTAMYHTKGQGRNHYQFYAASMNTRVLERLSLENSLRKSIEEGHFILHYQPKAMTKTGQIVGMEALVRWLHPEQGFISPANFIPIAEETGLIIPLGEWVLRTACAQTKAWHTAGIHLRVSVNLSAAQFNQKNLQETVLSVLEETQLDPNYLELELTESLLMENIETSSTQLNELKSLGIHLSIDDFGTGYSSLSYLKRFPINTLKIDQSFIRDIINNSDDTAIVAAIITLGHSLRLKVIAEGVEKKAQLEFLRNHHCDQIQGYILSRPLPADAFFEYVCQYNQDQNTRPKDCQLKTPQVANG